MQSSALPQTAHKNEAAASVRPRSRGGVRTLYVFDDCPPERMLRICRLLQKRSYHGESAVYVMPHARRFYLCVEEVPPSAQMPFPPTMILEEFGTRIAAASMLSCLDEHARCLCPQNAVAELAALSPKTML